ncbi:MAG: glycosyltransferase family protein [Opitutales bacterium]
MRIIFAIEGEADIRSLNRLRFKLMQKGHTAHIVSAKQLKDSSYDLYFLCLCPSKKDTPIEKNFVEFVQSNNLSYAFLQTGDPGKIRFNRIATNVADDADLFISNNWKSNIETIPSQYRDKIGFIQTHVRGFRSSAGTDLKERPIDASFLGSNNHAIPGNIKARERLMQIVTSLPISFSGGILPGRDTPLQYQASKVSRKQYFETLSKSKICLAPWGSHPISYRIFEGLSRRCLVFVQSLKSVRFLDGGLRPGIHYVEVDKTMSNLEELILYYLQNLEEAQNIANNGYEKYGEFFESGSELVSEPLLREILASWKEHYEEIPPPGPLHTLRTEAYILWNRINGRL